MLTLWAAGRAILDFDTEKDWLAAQWLLPGGRPRRRVHRHCNELPAAALPVGVFLLVLGAFPVRGAVVRYRGLVPVAALVVTNYLALGEFVPAYSKFGGPWYEFEGAYWIFIPGAKHGIDWAGRNGETKLVYCFHLLIGHHGLFALTPVYLLSVWGMVLGGVAWSRAARLLLPHRLRTKGTRGYTFRGLTLYPQILSPKGRGPERPGTAWPCWRSS